MGPGSSKRMGTVMKLIANKIWFEIENIRWNAPKDATWLNLRSKVRLQAYFTLWQKVWTRVK